MQTIAAAVSPSIPLRSAFVNCTYDFAKSISFQGSIKLSLLNVEIKAPNFFASISLIPSYFILNKSQSSKI